MSYPPPALPSGYDAQTAVAFTDPTGLISFQLRHVYGPSIVRDGRGPIARLDHDRSYWHASKGSIETSLTYRAARDHRRGLTFNEFSAFAAAGPELRDLASGGTTAP